MSLATLNGNRCTFARAQLPAWGLWFADATIDVEATIAGAVTLQIGDLVLKGTVMSGGPYKGQSSYRIVGGAGGWGRELPAKSYNRDAGVKAASIVQDAANEAVETVDVTGLASTEAGYAFAREAAPAARVLELLVPRAWYVGEDGITRIGRRPSVEYSGSAMRMQVDEARGVRTLATEAIATLVPGAVVDGFEALDVWHELGPKGLRTVVWTSPLTDTSRAADAMRKLFEALDPGRRYRGVTEYRVISQSGERLNLQAVRASSGMPDLMRVRVRPGVPGCRADWALASSALVTFIDGDPTRPIVIGAEDPEGSSFAPSRLDLVGEDDTVPPPGTDAAGRALRYGDTVMMPSGAAATPTPTVLVPNPAVPSSVSRVRP